VFPRCVPDERGSVFPIPDLLTGCVGSHGRYLAKLSSVGSISEEETCEKLKGLIQRQVQMCKRNLEVMDSVRRGAQLAIEECQYQFRNRRWNCSTLDTLPVFGKVVTQGELGLEGTLSIIQPQALPWAGCPPPHQVAQGPIQPGVEHIQGRGKNFFPVSNINLPPFSSKPFPLVLSLSACVKSHSPPSISSFWVLEVPWSLPFSRLNTPAPHPASIGAGCTEQRRSSDCCQAEQLSCEDSPLLPSKSKTQRAQALRRAMKIYGQAPQPRLGAGILGVRATPGCRDGGEGPFHPQRAAFPPLGCHPLPFPSHRTQAVAAPSSLFDFPPLDAGVKISSCEGSGLEIPEIPETKSRLFLVSHSAKPTNTILLLTSINLEAVQALCWLGPPQPLLLGHQSLGCDHQSSCPLPDRRATPYLETALAYPKCQPCLFGAGGAVSSATLDLRGRWGFGFCKS